MDDSEPLDDEGHLRLPFDAPKDTAHPAGDDERSRGREPPSEPVTVRKYLMERWLPSKQPRGEGGRRHRGSLGVGTYTTYRGDLEAYVLPRIGDQQLDRLTPDDLDHLYDQLETNGSARGRPLSPKTIANVHSLLHKAFADAVRRGDLDQNPADSVEAPRARRPITDVWSVDELRTFLDHVRNDRFYAAWLLFATTGMRRGEVAGLAWDDLDLEHGLVRVRWTLGNINGRATWKPTPKTRAGERTMSLDPDTVAALEAHRERQSAERLAAGRSWTERNEDWRGTDRERVVFTWPDGRSVHPERYSRHFARHVEAAGLRTIRLHDLRHTYATAALQHATGWHDVKVISQRLGHASVGITLDTYAHVLPAADEETAHTLARLIIDGPGGQGGDHG